MNLNEIQDLIKFVAKSGVTEVEIERKDFKITIKSEKQRADQQIIVQAPAQVAAPVAQPAAPAPVAAAPAQETPAAAGDDSKYITFKSPMIGTFYRSAGPDKEAFVSVGQSVTSGTTICIIEAMKLFNEIEAEFNGKIVKVLVDDASPVEYDQPLFLIDPA
ncbi:MAG: acetyl-CoA carboxylase, biotin carboxyl carrier protein [Candidatus Fluviicola riflensis]|nr:MAG: acetyl-CoA carboxylase, biotin carboxyl carrier protein [Candidatus Fluviicola riflensis]OGS77779.1 MAG: acetyl-CoA carboxylase, biotin carboxyl carrier protein [Candidatus Fluviicola riflensis]OGS84362.1 MAG: acetyl-CoA carboxylase, biotin carboxyl carrier protein [Fluviicola sp. RIFCSPHIGHO2_12_FULL_43_24]OGS84844.1 MAG: acetyl-CoA carboxylase, biotin carboxyl carrier protein [Fluviicola sp. RIFCSPHIGHO2_01_FULL_43_53]